MRHSLSAAPAIERNIIEAAVAINDAPTLDEAFNVLAETGRTLLGADMVTIVLWEGPGLSGVVRAAAGEARRFLGLTIPADRYTPDVLAGFPHLGPPDYDSLAEEARPTMSQFSSIARVGLVTESYRATFQASYRDETDETELAAAVETLATLTRLTTLAQRARAELEEERLETVLGSIADGVIVTRNGHARANAAAQALLGLPGPEVPSTEAFDPRDLAGTPLPADERPPTAELAQDGPQRFRIRVTALDGRELVVDGSLSPTPNGDGAVIVLRDVTEEHERADLNAASLRTLFDALPIAAGVLDPETHEVIAANRALCDLVGYDHDEIVGALPPFPWWVDPDADQLDRYDGGHRYERVFRRKDGRPIPVEITGRTVRASDGRTIALIGVMVDLSERRQFERQLVQSGKLAAIGELAAGVAHEINNPLFAILGLTEFLLKDAEPGSKPAQRLELIQQTGVEIKEIVRALLDFARENADERHLVSIADVALQTADLVQRTNAHKGIELVVACNDEGAPVAASPNQIKQIFLNLVANARQAMPDGGVVTIGVHRDGEHVVATVADDGPGIAPDVVDRIFEPFFTTKRDTGGTGLGLSVSIGIAEAHGGSLTVETEEGHGATFSLRLPVASEEDE
jgi:PAS domain S-box-containing protein